MSIIPMSNGKPDDPSQTTDPIETFFAVCRRLEELQQHVKRLESGETLKRIIEQLERLEATMAQRFQDTTEKQDIFADIVACHSEALDKLRTDEQASADRLNVHSQQLTALLNRLDSLNSIVTDRLPAMPREYKPGEKERQQRNRTVTHESEWSDDDLVGTTIWLDKTGPHQRIITSQRISEVGRRMARLYREFGLNGQVPQTADTARRGNQRLFRVGDLRVYAQWFASAQRDHLAGGPEPSYEGFRLFWKQHQSSEPAVLTSDTSVKE